MPFPPVRIGDFDSASGDFALLVWRTGCGTSRMTAPYWQRLAELHPDKTVVAVCQDGADQMETYSQANGLTLRQFSDDGLKVSRALGVQTVPSYWLVQNGKVVVAGVGWLRSRMQEVHERLGGKGSFFMDSDTAPALQPG